MIHASWQVDSTGGGALATEEPVMCAAGRLFTPQGAVIILRAGLG